MGGAAFRPPGKLVALVAAGSAGVALLLLPAPAPATAAVGSGTGGEDTQGPPAPATADPDDAEADPAPEPAAGVTGVPAPDGPAGDPADDPVPGDAPAPGPGAGATPGGDPATGAEPAPTPGGDLVVEVSSRAGSGVVVLRIECVSGVVETVVDGVPVQTSSSTIEERRIPVIPEAPSSAVVVDVPTGSDCSVDVAEPGGGTVVEARGGAGLLAPGGTLIGVRVTTAGDPTTVGVVLEFPVQVAGEQAGRPDPVPPAVGGLPATGGRPGRLAALGATCLAAGLVLARAARRRPRAPA